MEDTKVRSAQNVSNVIPSVVDMENPACLSGIINYHFPFMLSSPLVSKSLQKKYANITDSPQQYNEIIRKAIFSFVSSINPYLWVISWLPNDTWKFNVADCKMDGTFTPIEYNMVKAEFRNDLFTLISSENFYFLSESFRLHPSVKLRLTNSASVIDCKTNKQIVPVVWIDIYVNLLLGHGCITLRHSFSNFTTDNLINLRLCQFRNECSLKWIFPGTPDAKPVDLQIGYQALCRSLFQHPVIPTYDVRRYGTTIELLFSENQLPLNQKIFTDKLFNKKWLYGLLFVDEHWRNASIERVHEKLLELHEWHNERYLQFAQSVSLLTMHNTMLGKSKPNMETTPLIDDYYSVINCSNNRSIADRACLLEKAVVQENVLHQLYNKFRSDISQKGLNGLSLSKLKHVLVLTRQDADECQNCIPGAEVLSKIRDYNSLEKRIDDAITVIEASIDERKIRKTDFLSDVAIAGGTFIGLFPILLTFHLALNLALRWAIIAGMLYFSIARLYRSVNR